MKHIHIVSPYQSVAMQRMTIPLIQEFPALYVLSHGQTPDENADLNYHVPYHTLTGYEGKGLQAMAYTHCNPPDLPALMDACNRADIIICMSFTGRRELVSFGVDQKKLWVIYSAADNFQYRKRIIGVVGFAQPNGRKRENILLDLAWKYDLVGYHFVIAGEGWEPVVDKMKSLGVSVQHIPLANDERLRELYGAMDALLVTGYAEGGPLPLLEAMACGVPVISPPFGYAGDLLEDDCTYTTVEELWEKLDILSRRSIVEHQIARAWSWWDYAAEHAFVFSRMLGESTELFSKQGMNRYSQLMDVIDALKPKSIVEVGTWNGNRAIQMIQQAAKHNPTNLIYYQGFDLFETQTGEQLRSELSKAGWPIDVVRRRIEATSADVELVEGNTLETIKHVVDADLYFIDGGHSEKTIINDWRAISAIVQENGGVVVFDDYYHEGAPAGIGCNKIIDTLSNEWEVTHLPARTLSDDGREIGMVMVRSKDAGVPLQMQEQPRNDSYTWTS